MVTGIILILTGVVLMGLFGALGNYYIQKANSSSSKKNQTIILEKIASSKEEIIKNSVNSLKEPKISIPSEKGIEIKGSHFWLCIESLNAGSTNYKLESHVVAEYEDGLNKVFQIELLPENQEILTKAYRALIPYDKDIKVIYLNIKGSYTNLSQSANYQINKLFHYDVKTGLTYGRGGIDRERVL